MVDKNINIYYKVFTDQAVASNKKMTESLIPIAKQSRVVIDQVGNAIKSTSYDIQQTAVQNRDAQGRFASGFQVVSKEVEKNIRTVEDHRQRFKMYLLSVMFFGMIIQRTFQNMATTTLNTFMKITEAQTAAGQAVTSLSAHWEFLKFSVGEAIGQFIEANPWILEMIDSISEFAQQNGQLIAKIILAGIVIGATFGVIGQVGLGINGLTMFGDAIKTAIGLGGGTAGAGGLTALITALGGASNAFVILAAFAAIAAISIAAYMAYPEIGQNAKNTATDLMGIFGVAWSFINNAASANFEKISTETYPSFVGTIKRLTVDLAAGMVNSWIYAFNEIISFWSWMQQLMGKKGTAARLEMVSAENIKKSLGFDKDVYEQFSYLKPEEKAYVAASIKGQEIRNMASSLLSTSPIENTTTSTTPYNNNTNNITFTQNVNIDKVMNDFDYKKAITDGYNDIMNDLKAKGIY